MFYSIAGSIVRWVSEGIILLKDWPAETGICKRFASLGRFMQRVFYMAESFSMRSLFWTLYVCQTSGLIAFPWRGTWLG